MGRDALASGSFVLGRCWYILVMLWILILRTRLWITNIYDRKKLWSQSTLRSAKYHKITYCGIVYHEHYLVQWHGVVVDFSTVRTKSILCDVDKHVYPPVKRLVNASLGYLLIYPPQIATVMKLISFCSKYNLVSHTKSLGESQEWNMVFQGNIWSRMKAFKNFLWICSFWLQKVYSALNNKQST